MSASLAEFSDTLRLNGLVLLIDVQFGAQGPLSPS